MALSPHSALSSFLKSYPGLASAGVRLSSCGLLSLVLHRLLPGLPWPGTSPPSLSAMSLSDGVWSSSLSGGDSGGDGGGGPLCTRCRGGGLGGS